VVFISAKGRGYIGGIDSDKGVSFPGDVWKEFTDGFIRTYKAIYDQQINDNGVTNWFLQRLVINSNLVAGAQKFSDEAVFVLECLEKLSPEWELVRKDKDGRILINCALVNGTLQLNNIPFQNLSTGYASILRIIQEIVSGISSWNLNSDFKNSNAIVFIDEIDLHLHPEWQFEIVDILKKCFPKVTFYITTHSPLILFKLKNGESYKLNKDEENLVTAEKVVQTNMHFIADVFEEFFNIKDIGMRPVDKDAMLKAREEFFNMAKDEVSDE
jgi:AAA15 family ATPase/GTPase